MKTWQKASRVIIHGFTGTWHLALGFSGLALALAAGSGDGNGTRWARSAATAWGLTRHDGTSVLDWISIVLVVAAITCFAFSLRAAVHKVAALTS